MKVYIRKLMLLPLIVILLFACVEDDDNWNKRERALSLFFNPDEELMEEILSEVEVTFDALQVFSKRDSGTIMFPNSLEVERSDASAIYFDSDEAVKVYYSICNGNYLNHLKLPNRYSYIWDYDSGPECNSDLYWEFKFYSDVIYDTIRIPNRFEDMSFSTDFYDFEEGTVLNWTTSDSGKVAVSIHWRERYEDGETGWTNTAFYGLIENNGRFEITSEVLDSAGVPDNSSEVFSIGIGLDKWNIKTKSYGNNKELVNLAIVNSSANILVNQK